ncbi:MAG: hypothetical protein C3F10_07120 [Dehalococcoidia bacterium]|nr:MAG: hypothetical protein C3F10_07120 [Dehalococcoidia bacterium]
MDRFRSSSWLTAFGAVAVAAVLALIPASAVSPARASGTGPVTLHVEQLDAGQFVYAVFHALDRDGFCNPPDGAVSLHPVINMPVDFVIEAGEGLIIETSNRDTAPGRSKSAIPTFSSALNAASANPVRSFPPLAGGLADECQAWVKISQSIPGPLRVLVTVPGENGASTGFIADLARTTTFDVDLEFRWSLVTWPGEDGISPAAALNGAGGAAGITSQVTVIYGWDATTQTWQAFFPSGAGVPGANNLAALRAGAAYWVAIAGPGPVLWTIVQ